METSGNDANNASESMPETEWEVFEQRKRIPGDLQVLFGESLSTIRVSKSVHEKITTKHQNVIGDYHTLNSNLERWQAYRIVNSRWEIYMPERGNRDRLVAIIGVDGTGSLNLISLYLVRWRNWKNRLLNPRLPEDEQ